MTSPSELERAVKRTTDVLRSVGVPTAATLAWVALWQVHQLRPEWVPACLSFDRLVKPGPFTDVQTLALMMLDARVGSTGAVGWLVASREPDVRCRVAALWAELGDYDGDALGDALMVLLHG